jgi:hypothetical protein
MSKRRFEKRRLKAKKKPLPQSPRKPKKQSTTDGVPNAPTIWRTMHLDARTQDVVMAATLQLQPSLLDRDAATIEQIENAATMWYRSSDVLPNRKLNGLEDQSGFCFSRHEGPECAR